MSLPLENWLQCVHPGYRLIREWELSGGISTGMTAFEIEDPNGARSTQILRQPSDWALSQNPNAAASEFRLLQLNQRCGIAAQTPLFLDSGKEYFDRPSLIIGYVSATPELAPANLEEYLRQFAQQLAVIHQIKASLDELSFITKYRSTLPDRSPSKTNESDTKTRFVHARRALETHWPIPQMNRTTLLHGDFWPGNTLWKGGKLTTVIDWEESCLGDPLVDLAISRLDIYWLFGREARNTFTDHYLSIADLDTNRLPFWDLYAALRPGSYIDEWSRVYPGLGREDINGDTMKAVQNDSIEEVLDSLYTG